MSFTTLQQSLIGSIFPYAGSILPLNKGWFLCDGASYLRSEYPDLFAVIGNNFGTADGTHFNVPDLRGQFLKGYDPSNAYQSAGDGATTVRIASKPGGAVGASVGSYESDYQRCHCHCISAGDWDGSGGYVCTSDEGDSYDSCTYNSGQTENYPKNVAINFIIKY